MRLLELLGGIGSGSKRDVSLITGYDLTGLLGWLPSQWYTSWEESTSSEILGRDTMLL